MAGVIFTAKFRDTMYENMWSYINPEMIAYMFNLKTSTIKGVENDHFTAKHKNTICYKIGEEDSGHYVYVNDEKEAFSTYEKGLLRRDADDGVCHGASMIYALHANRMIPEDQFILIDYPKTVQQYRENYKSILNFYIYMIESGLWDKALSRFFYNDVDWINGTTKQTVKSLQTLREYIKRFA